MVMYYLAVFEDVACAEVGGDDGVVEALEVGCDEVVRDIPVVELRVAHGRVNIEGGVLGVFLQHGLVDLDRLLVGAAQKVHCREREAVGKVVRLEKACGPGGGEGKSWLEEVEGRREESQSVAARWGGRTNRGAP